MLFKQRKINGKGKEAETAGRLYLENQGLETLFENYNTKSGEIDLIMLDTDTITFVEVRMRTNRNYGSALESVNRSKQQKIRKAALDFMSKKQLLNSHPMRFDVLGYDGINFNWIQGAF